MVYSDPLWELLLATNLCHPGCGCEDDDFFLEPRLVERWIRRAGRVKAVEALAQLDEHLAEVDQIDLDGLSEQTSRTFESTAEVRAWMEQRRELLAECLA